MTFRTKLDFSSNRQVKQHEATTTILSGGTSFGLTFSALTTGPDLTTSGVSENYTLIASTFSGNTGTTVYTWYDARMNLAINALSAITSTNSATTQTTGQVYTPSSTRVIDGNTVNLEKSTRWSFNCRFKSVFSPYKDKKIGEFFTPIKLKPASIFGINYEEPSI